MTKEKDLSDDIKKLVIARLEVLPPDRKISIGSAGDFTKEQLIERVKKGDEVGKKIAEIELEFLQAMKAGLLNE